MHIGSPKKASASQAKPNQTNTRCFKTSTLKALVYPRMLAEDPVKQSATEDPA